MNIFVPAEDGGEVELSPFAITASLYRDSAPASEASSLSSRRSSMSSVTSSASYQTADDHPGDPPDYSVLEPLLAPKWSHPMRPSLLRFEFCLSDPPRTYWTPTPGGPIHARTSGHLDAARRGKEMIKQIVEARKGVICGDPIHGEPYDPSFSYIIIPHDQPAFADEYWMTLIRNGRQRKWRPISLSRFAKLVDRLDGWLNYSPEHWNMACQNLYLFSIDEHGHPTEWHDGESVPRRILRALMDPESTPRPGDNQSRSSQSSHLVTPKDTHAVLPVTPAIEIPKETPPEEKKEEPAALARGHRGRRHRRKEEDLAPPPIRPPKGDDWADWTGTRGTRGQEAGSSSTQSTARGVARGTPSCPVSSSRGRSSGRGNRAPPGPSPRGTAPSGSSQFREDDSVDRSSSGSSSSAASSMRRSTSAESDLNANAPVFVPRRASSSSVNFASTAAIPQAVDADATPRPGGTVAAIESRVPSVEFPAEPLTPGEHDKEAALARSGASTSTGTQPRGPR